MSTDYKVVFATAAATRMRASELSGLRWSDVNLTGGRCGGRDDCPTTPHLHITGGLHRVNGGFTRQPPKSRNGLRMIPLSESTAAMLARYRTAQTERRLLLGLAWTDEGLVFDGGRGNPLDPALLGVGFRRVAKVTGLKGTTFHSLRHYGITQAVNAGENPGKVSRVAGYGSVGFTLSTYYSHDPEEATSLASVVESTLGDVIGGL